MKQLCFTLFVLGCCCNSTAQVLELGIKPTELLFLNFETGVGIGKGTNRYGVILGYRPSTRDSGKINSGGTGAAGGYGHRYRNRLYQSYTLGMYYKRMMGKSLAHFIQAEAFYRNWHFDRKPAEFRNAEGYEFNGLRTENVDVFAFKLLYGKTFMLSKKTRKYNPYLDFFFGAGIRYQEEQYETFNGFVRETFYNYKKDVFYVMVPTPQMGIVIGLMRNSR